MSCRVFTAAFLLSLGIAASASAQSATIGGPLNGANHSFSEHMGVGFSGRVGNVFFNNGGFNNALPPFGGHNPANDAHLGFGIQGNGFNLNFGIAAGTGSDSSISSVSPSVTVMNGGTGSIFSGQQRPFVTGLVPMVGHFGPGPGYTMAEPRVVSPLAERLSRLEAGEGRRASQPSPSAAAPAAVPRRIASSAERGDLSLAEIRAQQAAAGDPKADELAAALEAARLREEAGEIGPALIDYGRAATLATGAQRDELRAKMRSLREQLKRK